MKKRLISFLLTVVMLVSLCTAFGTSASADSNVIPVPVADGDTVLKLCQRLGVDFYTHKNLINTLNGFTSEADYRRLTVGDYVMLPANEVAAAALEGSGASAVPLAAGGTTAAGTTPAAGTVPAGQTTALPAGDHVAYYLVWYTVQRGQTIDSIYRDWGLNYRTYDNQIRKLNNITSYTNLAAQKTYLLPTTNPAVANSAYYTVMAHTMRSGENAYDIITSQYGLNFGQVQQMTLSLNNTSDLAYIGANTTLYIPVSGIVSPSTTVSPTTAAVTTTATVSTSANYNLVSQTSVNGNFALMVDGKVATTAQAGKVVSVIATPDTGYGLDMIRVTKVGETSTAVAVNNNSFIMPNYSVIVSVTFKTVPSYNITLDSNKDGSLVAMVNGSAVNKGFLGSTVSVRAIPKPGFKLDTIRVTYNNYKDSVAVENNTFIMPATNVTVTANFVSDPDYDPSKGNLVFINANNCKVTASVGNEEVQYAKQGDLVALNIVPFEGYTITSVKVYSSDFTNLIAVDKFGFTMPNTPVNVVVEAKLTASADFAINVVDPVNGNVYILDEDENEIDSALVGQLVTVYGEETKPAYNYVTTVYKTDDPAVAVPVQTNSDGSASFIMPDFEVTVRVKFYTLYNIRTHASNGTHGTYGVAWSKNPSVAVAEAGAGVELQIVFGNIEPGYTVSDAMLIYADGSSYSLDGPNFIMPDCDVTVKVSFARSTYIRAYSVTDKDNNATREGNAYMVGGKILNDLKEYTLDVEVAAGSNVTVMPEAEVGYVFDEFVVNYRDPSGNYKSQTVTAADKNPTTQRYQFQMPEIFPGSVVELRVYFKEISTYSLLQDYTNACDPANINNDNADQHMGTFGFMTVYDKCDHAAEDTKLYIRSFAEPGYLADLSGVRIYRDNKDGSFTDVTADPDVNYDPTNYSFFMPPYDVRIYVPFTESQFWVKLEKSYDSSRGMARGEITLVVNGTHFTEETLTLVGSDKNNTRKVFEPGTIMQIVNTSSSGYFLRSENPFSIFRVDKDGNPVSADLAKSLMLDGYSNTFVMPAFNIAIRANYDDEVVTINKVPCEHGSFSVPSQVAWGAPFVVTEIYPDEGFELSDILLTYVDFNGTPHKNESYLDASESGSSRTLQLVGGGKPQSEVTIELVFEARKNSAAIHYEFSDPALEGGDYYNVNLFVWADPDAQAAEISRDSQPDWTKREDTIGLKADGVTPNGKGIPTGARVMLSRSDVNRDENFNITYVKVDNKGVPVEVRAIDDAFYFEMPYVANAKDLVITVYYSRFIAGSFYLHNKTTGTEEDILDVTYTVDGNPSTMAKPGQKIVAKLHAPDDTKIISVLPVYTNSDGLTNTESVDYDKTTGTCTFTLNSLPVPATVSLEYTTEHKVHQIDYNGGEWTVTAYVVDEEGQLQPADKKANGKYKVTWGSEVVVDVAKAGTDSEYATTITLTGAEETEITAHGGGRFSFVMPKADVKIEAERKLHDLIYDPSGLNAKDGVDEFKFIVNGTPSGGDPKTGIKVGVGDTITIQGDYENTTDKRKFTVSRLYVNDIPVDGEGFKMPDEDVTVRVDFVEYSIERPVYITYTALSESVQCTFTRVRNGVSTDIPGDGTTSLAADDIVGVVVPEGYVFNDFDVIYARDDGAPGAVVYNDENESFTIMDAPASEKIEIIVELGLDKAEVYPITVADLPAGVDKNAVTLHIDSEAEVGSTVNFELAVRYDLELDRGSFKLTYENNSEITGNSPTVETIDLTGGKFDESGMAKIYAGSFTMPDAKAEISFDTKEANEIIPVAYSGVAAVEERTTKGGTFHILPEDKTEQGLIIDTDNVMLYYSVFDSTKEDQSRNVSMKATVTGPEISGDWIGGYKVTAPDENTMGHTIYVEVNYKAIP